MLPIPHVLLFVPFSVLAVLFAAALAVNAIAGFTPSREHARPAGPRPAEPPRAPPRPSAEIIYFRQRKTSLASALGAEVGQQAMQR